MATFQLEYSYLAKMTSKKEHYDKVRERASSFILSNYCDKCILMVSPETSIQVAGVMKIIENTNLTDTYGMLPTMWNITTGQPNTIGTLHSVIFAVIMLIHSSMQTISQSERTQIAVTNTY